MVFYFNIVRCFTALNTTFSLNDSVLTCSYKSPPTISYALHTRLPPHKYFAVTMRDLGHSQHAYLYTRTEVNTQAGTSIFIPHIQPLKMELIQCSETSAYCNLNQTPGKYRKEYIHLRFTVLYRAF